MKPSIPSNKEYTMNWKYFVLSLSPLEVAETAVVEVDTVAAAAVVVVGGGATTAE